jgi:hypothetical protein
VRGEKWEVRDEVSASLPSPIRTDELEVVRAENFDIYQRTSRLEDRSEKWILEVRSGKWDIWLPIYGL